MKLKKDRYLAEISVFFHFKILENAHFINKSLTIFQNALSSSAKEQTL